MPLGKNNACSKSQTVLTFTFNIQGEDYAADYSGAVGSVSSEESLSEALDPATDGVSSSPSPIREARCPQNGATIFGNFLLANLHHLSRSLGFLLPHPYQLFYGHPI